ncbi:hypothetical protein OSB04_023794 [Centaurea solstitialis]|uniref:Uncharacterized protein n=1 Tax=Centaurea solstitialis TaxID=347529 RepID=A0AA38W006_9ASTR|nr:hypothetical protein OSB04_023794 [Centaurea solstitialis]
MTHRPSEPLHSVLIPWPFMRWGMDIVGKSPPATEQKIEVTAFSQLRDKKVISCIPTNIICRFDVPSEIISDDIQFISKRQANRMTPRTSTGQTSFSLVYGSEAVLTTESHASITRNKDVEQNSVALSYDVDT